MITKRLTPTEVHDISVLLDPYTMPTWAFDAFRAIAARRHAERLDAAYAWDQHCERESLRIMRELKEKEKQGDPFAELMLWPLDQIDSPRFAELCRIVFGEDQSDGIND